MVYRRIGMRQALKNETLMMLHLLEEGKQVIEIAVQDKREAHQICGFISAILQWRLPQLVGHIQVEIDLPVVRIYRLEPEAT